MVEDSIIQRFTYQIGIFLQQSNFADNKIHKSQDSPLEAPTNESGASQGKVGDKLLSSLDRVDLNKKDFIFDPKGALSSAIHKYCSENNNSWLKNTIYIPYVALFIFGIFVGTHGLLYTHICLFIILSICIDSFILHSIATLKSKTDDSVLKLFLSPHFFKNILNYIKINPYKTCLYIFAVSLILSLIICAVFKSITIVSCISITYTASDLIYNYSKNKIITAVLILPLAFIVYIVTKKIEKIVLSAMFSLFGVSMVKSSLSVMSSMAIPDIVFVVLFFMMLSFQIYSNKKSRS